MVERTQEDGATSPEDCCEAETELREKSSVKRNTEMTSGTFVDNMAEKIKDQVLAFKCVRDFSYTSQEFPG